MKLAVLNNNIVNKKLAAPIYLDNGTIFLSSGIQLTEKFIERINNLGIKTVYLDTGHDEVTLQEVMNSGTKLHISKALSNELNTIKRTQKINEAFLKNLLHDILNEINLSENAFLYNNIAQSDSSMKLALHLIDVTILAIMVGHAKKFDDKKIFNLGMGALLHDFGKIFTTGPEHTIEGYKFIKDNTFVSPTSSICILQHHERIDGTGYPNKLSDDKIYEFSKIISICNEYINLLIDQSLFPNEIMEKILSETPRKFDSNIYKDFTESVYCYPNGLTVKLSNGVEGIVVKQNKFFPLRPVILRNEKSKEYIDLMSNLTLFIKEIVI